MMSDDEAEIAKIMRAARAKARGYADFFGWATDRDLEEWGVASALFESLEKSGRAFFSNLKRRGRPNDPPDCEAVNSAGGRIAIEVTELVDGDAIRAFKEGRVYDWADWSREKFLSKLTELIARKDGRFPELKDAPYEGGYVLIVFCDEPMLPRPTVMEMLSNQVFERPSYIDRVFLILSHDPAVGHCPYFELAFNG